MPLQLDGSNGKVTIGNPANLRLSGAIAIAAGVQTDSPGSLFRDIVSKNGNYALSLYNGLLSTYDWSVNQRISGPGVADGEHHVVAVVIDQGVVNGSQFYVDGAAVGPPFTIGENTATSDNLTLGALSDNLGNFENLAGSIDNVTIWNSLNMTTLPLGWWKMDEISGMTAADSGSGGNVGTRSGGTTWVGGAPPPPPPPPPPSATIPYVLASSLGFPVDGSADVQTELQGYLDSRSDDFEFILDGVVIAQPMLRSNVKRFDGIGFGKIVRPLWATSCIRNYNWTRGAITDSGLWLANLTLDGQRRNNPNADPRTLANDAWIMGVQMYGVLGLRMDNVSVVDSPTFGIHLMNTPGAVLCKPSVVDPVQLSGYTPGRNTDGIHINGPNSGIRIYGAYLVTGDDAIGICADDGVYAVYGDLMAGGDVTDVRAYDTMIPMGRSVCRILSGTSFVDDTHITDATGNVAEVQYAGATLPPPYGPGGSGHYGNIHLRWRINGGRLMETNSPYIHLDADL